MADASTDPAPIYRLTLTTAAGRVLPLLIGQVADPLLAQPPLPNPGFGLPITWTIQ